MSADPFAVFARWLEWLDSHDGRLARRARGDQENDGGFLWLIPNPPGQAIFTVADLRGLVEAGKDLAALRLELKRLRCLAAVWLGDRVASPSQISHAVANARAGVSGTLHNYGVDPALATLAADAAEKAVRAVLEGAQKPTAPIL